MKDSIQKQFTTISTRYGWLGGATIRNMRLLLLILFALLSGYLVIRINSLVNSEVVVLSDEPTAVSKKLDENVLSTFNELYVQDVQLDSSFQENRENPF
jgi:hypothetical protein